MAINNEMWGIRRNDLAVNATSTAAVAGLTFLKIC